MLVAEESSDPFVGTSALVVLESPISVTEDVFDNRPYDTSVTCRGNSGAYSSMIASVGSGVGESAL